MENFTRYSALAGGALPPWRGEVGWRLSFLAGLLLRPLKLDPIAPPWPSGAG